VKWFSALYEETILDRHWSEPSRKALHHDVCKHVLTTFSSNEPIHNVNGSSHVVTAGVIVIVTEPLINSSLTIRTACLHVRNSHQEPSSYSSSATAHPVRSSRCRGQLSISKVRWCLLTEATAA
jgi:hypothetical protein